MKIDWALWISVIGIMGTALLALYFYKRTKTITENFHKRTTSMIEEMKEFLITLILNSAADPKTLERLLKDHNNTGKWRGRVERDPVTGGYHISWQEQCVTSIGIGSEEAVGKPTIIQSPPKVEK